MNTRKHAEAGMTLVELMLATAVLASVMVIMSGGVIGIANSGATAGVRTIATNLAQSIFEDMREYSPEEILSYAPPFTQDEDGTYIVTGLGPVELTLTALLADGTSFVIGEGDPTGVGDLPDPMEVQLEMTVLGHALVRIQSAMVVSSF